MPQNKAIPEPWMSFLTEIDRSLDSSVSFHCFGGFAIDLQYGLPRTTSDIDILAGVVRNQYEHLVATAGEGSQLHARHKVYLDLVSTIAVVPDCYEERLIEVQTPTLHKIRLFLMEPHDIVLSKLGRDAPKDIQDATHLAKTADLETELLRRRYKTELRPYVIGPLEREDAKFEYWLRVIKETQSQN